MGEPEINAFLSDLAVRGKVSASTQNQALAALLFLYRHVLDFEVGALGSVVRAKKPRRLPVVMTRREVNAIHEKDLASGRGRVAMPQALERKYSNASKDWGRQWVFPQQMRWRNLRTGVEGRHHIHETIVQRAVKEAVGRAGVVKKASCHTFRHCAECRVMPNGEVNSLAGYELSVSHSA